MRAEDRWIIESRTDLSESVEVQITEPITIKGALVSNMSISPLRGGGRQFTAEARSLRRDTQRKTVQLSALLWIISLRLCGEFHLSQFHIVILSKATHASGRGEIRRVRVSKNA